MERRVVRGDIKVSPTEGMEVPPAVKARDRWLADEELRRIWFAAPGCHVSFGRIVRLLIVTGQRREEVSSVDWKELDRDELLWTLPAERAKNGEPNCIPLNELAVSVIDDIAGGRRAASSPPQAARPSPAMRRASSRSTS